MRTNTGGAPARACAWCATPFPDEPRSSLAECVACGTRTTSPWPTAAQLDVAYAGAYRPASGRFAGRGDALLRWSRGRLARHLHRELPPGAVLDVGSGDGALLDALAAVGRPATGLERPEGADAADGRDVVASDVTELEERPAWAGVVFWHSLEHLPEPREALRRACRLLVSGGRLVVAVPNAASLQARVFGERWFHVDAPRHLVHLPASVLTAEVERAGLRVVSTSYTRGGQVVFGWLHGLVGLLPSRPDLYDAVRQPEARQRPLTPARRALVLLAGCALFPAAVVASAVEVALRRGGTVCVEAVRG